MRTLKMTSPAPALILLALTALVGFSACEDIGVFVDHLDDEVKLANDRYLEVVNTYPVQFDSDLSPRLNITVQFDRDVNPESLRDYILITQRDKQDTYSVPVPFDSSMNFLEFDSVNKELTIRPEPFLNGGHKISVSLLPGATATDGSPLRDRVSWSFSTARMPVGVLNIADGDELVGNDDALAGFTNDVSPSMRIAYSDADSYFITDKQSEAESISASDIRWKPTDGRSGEEPAPDFPFSWSGDTAGEKTLYVVYKDDLTGTLSMVESDTVYFDEDPPYSLNAIPFSTGWSNTPVEGSVTYNTIEDTTQSGYQKTRWTTTNGATFSDSDGLSTFITGPSASTINNMRIDVWVYDKAGNASSSSDYIYIDWDSQGPTPPSSPVSTDPETDSTPLWNWVSGGSDLNSGVGIPSPAQFSVSFNDGFWYTTTGTSYQYKSLFYPWRTLSLPDGRHKLEVRERDSLGNFSSTSTGYFVVNTAEIDPYDTETGIRGTKVTLTWPSISPLYSYVYELQEEVKFGFTTIDTGSTGTAESATVPSGLDTLSAGTTYRWRYVARYNSKITYTSPYYTFTTFGTRVF